MHHVIEEGHTQCFLLETSLLFAYFAVPLALKSKFIEIPSIWLLLDDENTKQTYLDLLCLTVWPGDLIPTTRTPSFPFLARTQKGTNMKNNVN